MRIKSAGHAAFAVVTVGLGVTGLMRGHFAPVLAPVPNGIPARQVLVYLCALVFLACGIGLLCRRVAALAARILLASWLVWMLAFRLPGLLYQPLFAALWPIAETAVMLAGTWVLYGWFAADWDRQHIAFGTGSAGLRIARTLYGLALIFFGAAHFIDLPDTLVLIPGWLPWHVFWAYFFGCTFIAAGVAVAIGVCARLAAVLATAQIALFLVVVWVPRVVAGTNSAFQWNETIVNCALLAGAWVLADSYRGARLAEVDG